MLAMQSKTKLVKKNESGSLEGDSTLQCNTNCMHEATEGHDTTKDSLSMHKLTIDHMKTENLEPQYQ